MLPQPGRAEMGNSPDISVLVIGYRMPRQLTNTLRSLASGYQLGITSDRYEVVVMENRSDRNLPLEVVSRLPGNFRYYLRDEPSQSPVFAIREGLALCRGSFVGLMVDGAHLLSPGVLQYASMALRITPNALVTVPVYHLGPKEQHESVAEGYDEEAEEALLASIDWPSDGYALFDISTWCAANANGFFAPIMESNCYFAERTAFEDESCVDTRFTYPGGGALNLHILRKLGTRPASVLFTLGGEGTFHQFHGGVTSNTTRTSHADQFQQQLQEIWGGEYDFLRRNPIVIGRFHPSTHPVLQNASEKMQRRFQVCRSRGIEVWPDDSPERPS